MPVLNVSFRAHPNKHDFTLKKKPDDFYTSLKLNYYYFKKQKQRRTLWDKGRNAGKNDEIFLF